MLYHIYLDIYITSDIYRFVDLTKDIVRAFKFITMGVLNICPDALRSPVELWSKDSDDQVKIARCATPPRSTKAHIVVRFPIWLDILFSLFMFCTNIYAWPS